MSSNLCIYTDYGDGSITTADHGYVQQYGVKAKVRDSGLGLRPRLYAGSVCDNCATEAVYAAIYRYIRTCIYLKQQGP